MKTPLEDFIEYKSKTGMQCGNYSIDLPELEADEQYRFHFDATKCIGCRCCEVACNEQNNNPADIKWRRVGEMEGGAFPDTLMLFNSMSCNHCVDPACLIGCPTESYIKFDNGIVFHDDDACIGCQYCTWNCPYSVPTYHEERKIVTKCHMCHERLDVGESPACVQACPSAAIEIEAVKVDEWLDKDIDEQGNMPHLVDARVTNSTTRYTLPDNMPENMKEADEHILKPFHSETPLIFLTVLTQMSLGAFFALFMGQLFSMFGFKEPSFVFALFALIPAATGLPLGALHLGRPYKAMMAMKNWRNSWFSREAIALAAFAGIMSLVVVMYFFNISGVIILFVEFIGLIAGVYGIYSQAMIYRIKARPSWDRKVTNMKFFATSYLGLYLIAFIALLNDFDVSVILSVSLLIALSQGFFIYEDYRDLKSSNQKELVKTTRLYEENFKYVHFFRAISYVIGAILLPILVVILISSNSLFGASVTLGLALLISLLSELSDRFLFYTTSQALNMAGSFFVAKQRG